MPRPTQKNAGSHGKHADQKFIVNEPAILMDFLMASMPEKSRTTIKSYLAHKQVLVGSKPVSQFNHPLEAGDMVTIRLGGKKEQDTYKGLTILFEDKHIVVISKESGLLSVATDKEKAITAYNIVSFHIKKANPRNRIFIVHRLDKDASGVMVFAKSEEIQEKMQREWQEAVMERIYSVVVEGRVEQKEGAITSYLKENKALVMYSSQDPKDGQLAITRYRLVKQGHAYSLLDVELETGRKNQIRVHMKDLGHPIAGDKKYGALTSPLGRLCLHARLLAFIHPVTGTEVRFEAAVPRRFIALVKEEGALIKKQGKRTF